MKDIDEIRRQNLRAESKRLGGDAELARVLKKDKNQIYQWIRTKDPSRMRTMRKAMARLSEVRLGREQGWLDVEHGIEEPSKPLLASGQVPAEARSKNNVKSLRFAMQSFCTVLHSKLPDVAAEVAEDIVETAGTEFVSQGFLGTLVGILQGVEQTSEGAVPMPPRSQVSSSSKRVARRAK